MGKSLRARYVAAPGAMFDDDAAQRIGRFLYEDLGGQFTTQQVVAASRSPRSPLHRFFEWNDRRAAELHRMGQARDIVNHIDIEVSGPAGPMLTKAFHSLEVTVVGGKQERRYVHYEIVAANEDMSRNVLQEALEELQGWRERYEEYRQVFQGVFREIDAAARTVTRKKRAGKPAKTVGRKSLRSVQEPGRDKSAKTRSGAPKASKKVRR